MVFTLLGRDGEPQSPEQTQALSAKQRAALTEAEQALRAEIARVLSTLRPVERAHQQARTDLRRRTLEPLLAQTMGELAAKTAKTAPSWPIGWHKYKKRCSTNWRCFCH